MSKKYVFVDWNDTDPGYGVDNEGYMPRNAAPFGVQIVAHQPYIDPNPVVVGDTPWETVRAGMFATVIQIGNKCHMWYDAIGPRIKLCYATSDDGVHWVKPALGLHEFNGSKDNNIIFNNDVPKIVDEGWGILYHEEAPQEERFKMVFTRVFYDENDNHTVWQMGAISPDGIHWTETGKLFRGGDTSTSLYYDKKRKKYVVFTKAQDPENIARRTLIRSESDDFIHWSEPMYVLHGDPNDDPDTDYYAPAYHPWKGAENAHVLFPSRFHRTEDYLDVQMAVSRDLYNWSKPSNGKVLIGPEQTQRKSNYAVRGLVEDGNGNWVHYFGSGTNGHHGGNAPLEGKPSGLGIYRFVFREDGYTSLHASSHGEITTLPRVRSKGMKVNAEIHFGGSFKIAATHPVTNKPHEGFDFDDCVLERIDNNSYQVKWAKPMSEIPTDIGYRLKFKMYKVDLYSYTLDDFNEEKVEDFQVPYVVACKKEDR